MTTGPNLSRLRRRIRRRMTAACKLVKYGDPVFDPATGASTPAEIVSWTGHCHIRPTSTESKYVHVAEQGVRLRTYEAWLPVDAALGASTTVVVTASLGDPQLVGRKLTIIDKPLDDWLTARRLICQAATA